MPGDGRLVPDNDTTTIGVPHNLAPSEQTRFATEVLQGVRTIRLALGLYLRGCVCCQIEFSWQPRSYLILSGFPTLCVCVCVCVSMLVCVCVRVCTVATVAPCTRAPVHPCNRWVGAGVSCRLCAHGIIGWLVALPYCILG